MVGFRKGGGGARLSSGRWLFCFVFALFLPARGRPPHRRVGGGGEGGVFEGQGGGGGGVVGHVRGGRRLARPPSPGAQPPGGGPGGQPPRAGGGGARGPPPPPRPPLAAAWEARPLGPAASIEDFRVEHHTESAYVLEQAMTAKGYTCITFSTGPQPERKAQYIQILEQRRVEGVFLIGSMFGTPEVRQSVAQHMHGIPVVLVNGGAGPAKRL